MRDLDLWRRLGAGDVTAAELAVVASWPLSRRGPFLAGVVALLGHGDAVLRAAAVRVLAGCAVCRACARSSQALDDADDGVRAAALDALRVTARDAPVRFRTRCSIRASRSGGRRRRASCRWRVRATAVRCARIRRARISRRSYRGPITRCRSRSTSTRAATSRRPSWSR